MNHLDLFSGIGGFALAAQWMGWNTKAFCERDPYCQKVLKKNFKDIQIHEDIATIPRIGGIDIITGGFPCQPFSVAGKQKSKTDDRYLWPTMLNVITQEKSAWVVCENVTGIIGLALDQVLIDLEAEGYATQSFIIPACAINAHHRRDRVWIVAHTQSGNDRGGVEEESKGQVQQSGIGSKPQDVPIAQGIRVQRLRASREQEPQAHDREKLSMCESKGSGPANWEAEPRVGRVVDGIPNRMDRTKGLGNAIVPQVVYEIYKAIETI